MNLNSALSSGYANASVVPETGGLIGSGGGVDERCFKINAVLGGRKIYDVGLMSTSFDNKSLLLLPFLW